MSDIDSLGLNIRPDWRLAVLTAVIGCLVLLALPGSASAAQCGGEVTLAETEGEIENRMEYSFRCNAEVLGYTIVSNRTIDFFTTEALSYDDSGEGAGEVMGCEGPFPSNGFGCRGAVNFGHIIKGQFATIRNPCEKRNIADRFRVWLVTFTREFEEPVGKPAKEILVPSHPRKMPIRCGTTQEAKRVSTPHAVLSSLFI